MVADWKHIIEEELCQHEPWREALLAAVGNVPERLGPADIPWARWLVRRLSAQILAYDVVRARLLSRCSTASQVTAAMSLFDARLQPLEGGRQMLEACMAACPTAGQDGILVSLPIFLPRGRAGAPGGCCPSDRPVQK